MDAVTTADMVLFEDFRLAPGGLSRRDQSGTFVPVWIGSRALEILAVLVARSGELVTRDEIIKKVWPGTIVEYSNLPVQIAALRRILDEGRVEGSCIQTIPGRGYRFAIPVRVCALRPEAVVSLPSPSRALGPSANQPDVAPRLSIVVLPFANLGNDPEQQYFADGITDDLTTDLSRISGSFVIARNTTFTYMAKPADAREIGRELGVRYVLEGSVRRTANQVRVNVQLIDAESGAHLWADRFDTDRANLAEAQDEIIGRLARSLNVELVKDAGLRIERERIADPDALDLVMLGRAVLSKPPSAAAYEEALRIFEQALEIDPRSVDAKLALGTVLSGKVGDGWSSTRQQDLARAERLLFEVLEVDPNNAPARQKIGEIFLWQSRFAESKIELETAIALDGNLVGARRWLARTLTRLGQPEAEIPISKKRSASVRAIHMSPIIIRRWLSAICFWGRSIRQSIS